MNGILNGGKTLRERILKNIFVCEIYYSKYQFMKNAYKIITFLFLQKSLEAYHGYQLIRDTAKVKVLQKSAL